VLILKVLVIWILQPIIQLLWQLQITIVRLFTINLTTGKAVNVGKFGAQIISIAFKTNPLHMRLLLQ
jgi:hypothetical protein